MTLLRSLVLTLFMLIAGIVPALANPMLVVDRDTLDVLYAQEAGQPWHPASLTKLMTAYVVFEQLAAGTVTLDTKVIISRKAANEPPSRSGLQVDSALTLKDALYVMLVKSANDVAMAIAETVGGSEEKFVAMMNDAARRMGLTATHYVDPNGLSDEGQVTTARDLAVLSLYIEQNFPQFMPIFGTRAVQLGKTRLESENKLLAHFAGTTGMKTGFICESGLNIVVTVDRNGRKLMAVVLGGQSGRDRNERAAELILKALSGSIKPTGQKVLGLSNLADREPVNMRPSICGKEAAAYRDAQEAAFPMGLKGQPSYLTDEIEERIYTATNLGRLRDGIVLPRPRPQHVAINPVRPSVASAEVEGDLRGGIAAETAQAGDVPFPVPRPSFLN